MKFNVGDVVRHIKDNGKYEPICYGEVYKITGRQLFVNWTLRNTTKVNYDYPDDRLVLVKPKYELPQELFDFEV